MKCHIRAQLAPRKPSNVHETVNLVVQPDPHLPVQSIVSMIIYHLNIVYEARLVTSARTRSMGPVIFASLKLGRSLVELNLGCTLY